VIYPFRKLICVEIKIELRKNENNKNDKIAFLSKHGDYKINQNRILMFIKIGNLKKNCCFYDSFFKAIKLEGFKFNIAQLTDFST